MQLKREASATFILAINYCNLKTIPLYRKTGCRILHLHQTPSAEEDHGIEKKEDDEERCCRRFMWPQDLVLLYKSVFHNFNGVKWVVYKLSRCCIDFSAEKCTIEVQHFESSVLCKSAYTNPKYSRWVWSFLLHHQFFSTSTSPLLCTVKHFRSSSPVKSPSWINLL